MTLPSLLVLESMMLRLLLCSIQPRGRVPLRGAAEPDPSLRSMEPESLSDSEAQAADTD